MFWKYEQQIAHWSYSDKRLDDEDDKRNTTVDYTHDTRPYLQLPHLISLTWLAYPIISLIFIVFRLQASSDTAQDAAANVKADLLASCKAAERAATSTASMPRFLAIATNQQITDAVNGTMNAARATMILALTIMEAIINFVIDIYRSTFFCFLELVVRGALSILLGAVDAINNGLSSTFNAIRSAIQTDVGGINKLIDGINSAISFVPGVSKISHIDVPSLDALQNVQLPSDFTTALQNLNNSLPSIADLKNKIEDIVDAPFELLKKDINETFSGINFDVNALPLPNQNTVTFCDQMDTSVVDDLSRDLVKIVKIGTAILIVLIVLLIAANCALEWYKWRAMKNHFFLVRESLRNDPNVTTLEVNRGDLYTRTSEHDLMSVEGTMSHPWVAKVILWLQARLKMKPSNKDKLSFFFNYAFHPPALACFLIGFFGLISVQLQLLAIGPIQRHYQQQASSSVSDFSNLIATSINASMYNDSATYAGQVNARVDAVQSTINDGMFGWVNGTTTTLNNTINAFYTDVQNVVNTVFGNTILNDPVQEFVRCFIGSKVDAIESALTFLHDNLHVDMPRVNDSVLVLSPASVNEATQPIALAAIGSGNDDNEGLVGRVVAIYVKSLEKERIMFAIFAGLWLVVVFMAICFLLWQSYGPFRHRSQRPLATVTVPISPRSFEQKPSEMQMQMHDVPLDDEKQQQPQDVSSRQPRPSPMKYIASLVPRNRNNGSDNSEAGTQSAAPRRPFWLATGNPFARSRSGKDQGNDTSARHSGDEELGLPYDSPAAAAATAEKSGWNPSRFGGASTKADDPFADKHSVEEPVPQPFEHRYPQFGQTAYPQYAQYPGQYGAGGAPAQNPFQ